jgi:hypothetical protein
VPGDDLLNRTASPASGTSIHPCTVRTPSFLAQPATVHIIMTPTRYLGPQASMIPSIAPTSASSSPRVGIGAKPRMAKSFSSSLSRSCCSLTSPGPSGRQARHDWTREILPQSMPT